jgi:D-serine deaminase-like pyridoxal phosphate-dependent protein
MNQQVVMETIPTPALVLDARVVRRNIQRMAAYAAVHRLQIRPHTKTHKSLQIAQLQLDSGALGLTAAKVGEAEIMSLASDDILLAYPALDLVRIERIAKLAERITMRVAIDSSLAADSLATAAHRNRSTIGILVDLDVGMGRTGVQSPQAALALAQRVNVTANLRLDGLLCYPGHIWNRDQQQAEPLAVVSAKLAEVVQLWGQHGLEAKIISGGSTPTAYQSHQIPQLTEIRPGTYVYNDMNTVHGGYCELSDCAAKIVSTVISTAVPHQVVLDAGSKTLTSDRCLPAPESGHGFILEYPHAKLVKLSEEHGQVDVSHCDRLPSLGERVTIIPNHICPCINLQDTVWWKHDEGHLEPLQVDARGKLV